jgi:hypothetical protein
MSEARIDRLESQLARIEEAIIRIEERLGLPCRILRARPNSPTNRGGITIGVSGRR